MAFLRRTASLGGAPLSGGGGSLGIRMAPAFGATPGRLGVFGGGRLTQISPPTLSGAGRLAPVSRPTLTGISRVRVPPSELTQVSITPPLLSTVPVSAATAAPKGLTIASGGLLVGLIVLSLMLGK